MRIAPTITVALVVCAATATATAQQSPQAEQLFRRGKELVGQGKFAEGCEKLEASQRLESNLTTLFHLAACREKNGQLATAWALFLRVASEARRGGADPALIASAEGFSTKLEPRLPFLTISVPDSSRIDGLTVRLDGRLLDPEEYNQGVPVDPGQHAVEGSAPGHEPWTATVNLVEAGRESVEVPRFKELASLAPVEPEAPDPVPSVIVDAPPPASPGRPTEMPLRRKTMIGATAVGAVGIVAMTAFGLQARGKWNDAKAANDDDLRQDAESRANLATVAGVVGVAGAAIGVTLWITDKPSRQQTGVGWTPVVAPHVAGLSVRGRF